MSANEGADTDEPSDGAEPEGAPPSDSRDDFVGMTVGGALLRKRIGMGGMGLVYEAWQDPPGRVVAVKLLREIVASDEVRVRFEHEARILAALRHPAIAQVHSAGTHRATTDIPYFLMEFVPAARTITEYVKEQELSLDETLALCARVCRGVQAGHAKGVIHRDLKPANILVDEDGHPKVIDFGIARMARADEDENTPHTETGQLLGTVPYMSPEQFVGNRDDIDTRCDVYALGVILYEALTGQLPYDLSDLGIIEAIETVRHKPPEPPAKLRPELAGDVSVIVLKALSKEPEARYGSAAALADELDRYLQRRPILARAPRLSYLIRMYAKRHKAAAVSMVAVAVTIVGALIAISLFAAGESRARTRAEREEARARALLHESARFIPEVADHLDNKLSNIVGTTRVRNLLAKKLESLAERLASVQGAADDPEVAYAVGAAELAMARIRGGASTANLGQGRAALEHFRRARTQFRLALAARPQDARFREALVSIQITLASQHATAGRVEAARGMLAQAKVELDAWQASSPDAPNVLGQRIDYERTLGHIHWHAGDNERSLSAYERANALLEAFPWKPSQAEARAGLFLQSHLDLATSLAAVGRTEEARDQFRALDALAAKLEDDGSNATHLEGLWHAHAKHGAFALAQGDKEQGRLRHERALALAQRILERDPNDAAARQRVRVSRGALGEVLERTDAPQAAREQYRLVLAAVRREFADDPDDRVLEWDLRVALTRLSSVESTLKAWKDARAHLDEARRIQTARTKALPDRAEEAAALAEVDYTDGLYFVSTADPNGSLDQNISAYTKAAEQTEAAVARLRALEEAGTLPAPSVKNLDLWHRMATRLRDVVAKLEGLR